MIPAAPFFSYKLLYQYYCTGFSAGACFPTWNVKGVLLPAGDTLTYPCIS